MPTTILARLGVAALGGSLLAAGLVVGGPAPASHAHDDADPTPAAIAADWLSGEDAALGGFGGFGWGASIDVALALKAAGGYADRVDDITTALGDHVLDYITGGAFDPDSTYAGPAAKAAYFAGQVGDDPTAFGGQDLVGRVEGTVQESGRVQDVSGFGDYANVFGQTFAARALTDADSAQAGAVTGFLLDQQCSAGFFRLDFTRVSDGDVNTSDPATDDGCDDATSAPSVDATALAIVVLKPLAATDPAIADALTAASDWLVTDQRANGSFDDGDLIGPNANSTGLAGNALITSGRHEAAEKAAGWLRSLQLSGTRCDGAAKADIGGVAYDGASLREALAGGIADRAKFARATSQAIPALLAAPESATTLTFKAPAFLDGGGKARIKVSGLAPGEAACVGVGRFIQRVLPDAAGKAVAKVKVPDRTGDVPVVVDTSDNSAGIEDLALAAAKLPVGLRDSVAPRGDQRVVVRGLASGEHVVVRQDGDVVARGTATTRGRFTATFPAPRAHGKHVVKARGQFRDRAGQASYQVR
ncbi:hypothetical protein [Nocardioides sp. MH1]|uniref:hypothetical protein n=1 Tax=Nocardioides sp. MH1 TaxID=3242490 RepID=UPI003521D23A